MDHDCNEHLEWIEEVVFDGNNDEYTHSFWVCTVCGAVDPPEPEPGPLVYDDYRPLDKG